jgi:chaperonin GroES
MATSIRPLHNRVLIKRLDEQEQMRGRLIIPDTAKEKPQQGEVIAAGEGKIREDGAPTSGCEGGRPRAVWQVQRLGSED